MNKTETGDIYIITNTVNQKKYVGQALSILHGGKEHGTMGRWRSHTRKSTIRKGDCRVLDRAFLKYGVDSFTVKTIVTVPLSELDDAEIRYIKECNTRHPNGYNLREGGNNGGKHCPETRKKIGASNKGLVVDEQGRTNIGKASKYRNMGDDMKTSIQEALDILELEHVPMYIAISVDKRHRESTMVVQVRFPKKPFKKFGKKGVPLHEKITLAIEYKNTLT
jgi:group I intron endonuclease